MHNRLSVPSSGPDGAFLLNCSEMFLAFFGNASLPVEAFPKHYRSIPEEDQKKTVNGETVSRTVSYWKNFTCKLSRFAIANLLFSP